MSRLEAMQPSAAPWRFQLAPRGCVYAAALLAFGFPATFAFAARIADHRFFVASMIALRPAALSLRLGFGGAA